MRVKNLPHNSPYYTNTLTLLTRLLGQIEEVCNLK